MTSSKVGAETPPGMTASVKHTFEDIRTNAPSVMKHSHRHQVVMFWYIFLLMLLAFIPALYFSFGPAFFGIPLSYTLLLNHLFIASILSIIILFFQRLLDYIIDQKTKGDNITFFNIRLVLRLISIIFICLIVLSAISQTWYTVPVAIAIFSIVAGFALQTPMAGFGGWIYILVRRPYRVGDRIKIAGATGDVIDISYFDTTLWEFGGQYLSTDHPSGRVIIIPNAIVSSSPVFNYSWSLFPYIWDEIRLHVAYNSDLDFVSGVMLAVSKEQVGKLMAERIRAYRNVLDKTPVNQIDVCEEPTVFFRATDDGWLVAIVRYLVDPKEAGHLKTELLQKILIKLNEEPDRVLFPKAR